MTDAPPSDEPGRANSPAAPGAPPDVTDRVAPGPPPPAANQGKHEPDSPAQGVTAAAGTVGGADPHSPHALPPSPAGTGTPQQTLSSPLDPVAELDAARTAPGAPPQSVSPGTSAPGNAQGVSMPATESAPGTSQQSHIVEGVRSAPGAVPGRPEGEVDTGR